MYNISVIIPIYNVEKYLEKCINSILNQTYKNIELILVNDGSKDSCKSICNRYAEKDSRIKVIHKENGGVSSARNKGIEIATGEYIAFVDSDDYIHKNMYELMINIAKSNKSDITICDFKYVNANNPEKINNDLNVDNLEIEEFTSIECLENLYGKTPVKFEVVWNKLYKRELFENVRYEESRIYEDSIIIHRLIYLSKKVIYLHCPLYMYLQREGSITSKPFKLKNLDGIYALKSRVEFFKSKKLVKLKYKADYDYRVRFIKDYYKAEKSLIHSKKVLREFKREFNKGILEIFKNPNFNCKEKISLYIFIISPYLYKLYIEYKTEKI